MPRKKLLQDTFKFMAEKLAELEKKYGGKYIHVPPKYGSLGVDILTREKFKIWRQADEDE